MKSNVWCLWLANNKNLGLTPHTLDYFETHFVGKSMARHWRPPPVIIDGKSKRLPDFVAWMTQAPVCSARAKDCLLPVIGPHVEFLPLVELRGKPYYAINVLRLVDCLDREKSMISYSPTDPQRILNIKTYSLKEERIEGVSIFMIPDDPSEVFVTSPFVEAVIKHGLRGAAFADPSANRWDSILTGRSANVVPGVPE